MEIKSFLKINRLVGWYGDIQSERNETHFESVSFELKLSLKIFFFPYVSSNRKKTDMFFR